MKYHFSCGISGGKYFFLIFEKGIKKLALDIWCVADKSKSLHNLNFEILPNFSSKSFTLFFIRYEMIFIGKAIHFYYGKTG